MADRTQKFAETQLLLQRMSTLGLGDISRLTIVAEIGPFDGIQ
jgi:hypothetical protein